MKTVVGIDASQLYPFSMTQEMPTGVATRWMYDNETEKFKPRKNSRLAFESRVMAFHQSKRPHCEIISVVTTGDQHQIGPYKVDGICLHCKTVFEVNGCWWHFHDCKQFEGDLQDQADAKRVNDEERRQYILRKGFKASCYTFFKVFFSQ
mgnify:CR=1 FL=1